MRFKYNHLGGAAPAALLILSCTASWAGTFDDNPVIGVFGDGSVFVDPEEGVIAPGIQAITTTINADFPNTNNPSGIDNCLMASNPDNVCTSPPGIGKRIKTRLTGPNGLDLSLRTQHSSGITEYYAYGKSSNLTGARITGLTLQFGTGTGADFVAMDASDPTLAALFDADFEGRFNLPDGLFGSGGQEGTGIGFFDGDRAQFVTTLTDPATREAMTLTNATHQAFFGDAMLDDTMVPDTIFWDASGTDIDTEEALAIGWFNLSQGNWLYGNLSSDPADLELRLQGVADSLGVTVADLDYNGSGEIPSGIVALMEENDLFEEAPLEDLRNVNLNFIVDLGDVNGTQVTLRILPNFVELVKQADSDYQFTVAAQLDAAANIPYWDLGNSAAYKAAIVDILALPDDEIPAALSSVGYGIIPAFSSLGYAFSQDQISAITGTVPWAGAVEGSIATQGDAQSWALGEDLYGLFSVGGSKASYSPSSSSVGYDLDYASFSFGLEKRVGASSSFGLVLGAATGTADAYEGLGTLDAKGLSVAAFARSQFGAGGTIQGVIGYQDLSYDSARKVMGEVANASTDGSQAFAAVRADYLRDVGAFKVGPTASLEYYDFSVDAFTETGAGAWNLSVGEQSGSLTLASIGVRGAYNLPSVANETNLTGSVEYTTASGSDMDIQSGFVGLSGADFMVTGMDDNWVDVGVGFESVLSTSGTGQTVLQAGYRGAFGDTYESHGLQVGMNITF